jgi:diapolycopene oxygenase
MASLNWIGPIPVARAKLMKTNSGAGKRVVVIGAGLGGMSAAISLAAAGFRVALYEKNDRSGGKLNVLVKDGFTFDLGPSILTLPQFFRSLFERAGRRFEDYVTIQTVSPHWRNFFENGPVIDLHMDPERMRDELRKLEGYDESLWTDWQSFLRYSREQYDILEQGYLNQGLDTLWDFIRFYGLFRIGRKIDYRRRMAESIRQQIRDSRLRMILEYFIKYVGSSAYDAPGYMNLMPNIQFQFDLWYVPGGLYGIARGFERLMAELNVELHYNAEVAAILHEDRRVTGIRLRDGRSIPAEYVVSNMEVIPAYQKLLGAAPRFLRSLDRFEPACSGLVVHLGTNRVYPQLAHHNFFYSRNQEHHFHTVFRDKRLPDDPTIYLVAPTRSDPGQAPPGCDNIKVLPHVPHLTDAHPYTREDYLRFKDRVLEKLERMGLTDLRKHIVVEDVWTPHDIQERYASHRGSIYGVVSDWRRNYGFKAPKRSRLYRNLFFTGGSVNPGGGMPMVVLCGQKVCDQILRQESRGS